MNTPVLLVGTGLLFWGWQAGLLPFAIPMAILLEGARRVRWRWEFTDRDFNRLTDFTNILFIGAALYLFFKEGAHGVFAIATWLPLLLFLLLASQIYSTKGSIGLTALILSLRRLEARGAEVPKRRIDLAYPYFAACLIATSVTTTNNPWFYPGVLLLTLWALHGIRSRRLPMSAWALLVVLAGLMGYAGQIGIRGMQMQVEEMVLAWFENRIWNRSDPYRTTTAIGHIGRLKFSDRIILQIKRPDGAMGPLLLRQASYRNYSFGTWSVGKDAFKDLSRGAEIGTWDLATGNKAEDPIAISGHLKRGRGLLALPSGTYRIENLPAVSLKRNPFGAIRVDDGPGFVTFRAYSNYAFSNDRPPEEPDLAIPERQSPVIEQIAAELGLANGNPRVTLRVLGDFFNDNFAYSLFSRAALGNQTPLTRFLLTDREGHCEYFATATVLLLRAAGIPSRYATGYSVQEYNPLLDTYLVRKRHAHSWALAYIGGNWVEVDFTPSVWASLEEETAPWWGPLYDVFSWANFAFQKWRWSAEDADSSERVVWLLLPLVLILGWRLYRQKKVTRPLSRAIAQAKAPSHSGRDSAFYRLLARLEELGIPRRPGETVKAWLARLEGAYGPEFGSTTVKEMLSLHYRYRFDPMGISTMEREKMRELVDTWLKRDQLTPP